MRCLLFFSGMALSCAAPSPQPSAGGASVSLAPASFDSVNAPWLEARIKPWSSDYVYVADDEIAGFGGHVVLVAATVDRKWSVVALHEERGVLGIVEGSDARWIGIDGSDALYRVLQGGVFERAKDAIAASNDAWEQRAAVPDATLFAAAGSVVAAAVGDAVYVSVDGAANFRKSVPRAGAEVAELYARHDGVLVTSVRGKNWREELFVSPDRGAHWARSSLRTGGIDQMGAWIYSACSGGVLSSDGKTWVENFSGRFDTEPLSRAIEIDTELIAHPREEFLNQTSPPAPGPADGAVIAGEHPCRGRHETVAPRVRMGSSGVNRCEGVNCLVYRRYPPYPTRTAIELFQDGLCEPHDGNARRWCTLPERLVRAPHALVLDDESKSARVIELPAGCRPMSVRSAGGISVLACFAGKPSLFVADRSGTWRAESSLEVSESSTSMSLQVTSDGSVLFHDDPREVRISHAWVRAPLSLGEQGAWRRLEYRDVAGWSAAPGGRALIVTVPEKDTTSRFTLWLDEPGRPPRELGRFDADGRRVLHVCGGPVGVRLLFESERGFEAHAVKNGRLVPLGVLANDDSWDWGEAVERHSALLCSDELALKNGAERR